MLQASRSLRVSSFSTRRFSASRLRRSRQEEEEDRQGEVSPRFKASVFFDPRVQAELRMQTGLDLQKVFRAARRGQKITPPEYKLVTDEELSKLRARSMSVAAKKLHMPPVMDERKEEPRVLDRDDALKGHDAHRLVFTDITYGVHDRDRVIVVREADGTLREAGWEERDRMNQVYFPVEGRKLDEPDMFKPDKLKDILRADRYEYILDRSCVQFEPDHPVFLRTAAAVYDHIDEGGEYDVLSSTRHYGPMVFHLVWQERADDLMVHYLQKGRMEDAHSLVRVYALLHPDSASSRAAETGMTDLEKLRVYIKDDSRKSSKVHICLESALEKAEIETKTREGTREAHGAKKSSD